MIVSTPRACIEGTINEHQDESSSAGYAKSFRHESGSHENRENSRASPLKCLNGLVIRFGHRIEEVCLDDIHTSDGASQDERLDQTILRVALTTWVDPM